MPPLPEQGEGRPDVPNPALVTTGGGSGIPWEHALLAISTVAALLSLIFCGWPSAVVWLISRIYGEYRLKAIDRRLILVSEAVNVVGFIVGQRLSAWL